jgi:glutathione S-transferase
MNMWLPAKPRPQDEAVMDNVRRIDAIWRDCLVRYGGPFLFGAFGAADAMYAPVVSRFHTYGLPVSEASRGYMQRVMALPAWTAWREAALQEPWIMRHNEPDWPLVRGLRVE